MPEYYARIEAVNLSYSVYDTNDISTIRGGSFMALNAFKNLVSDAEDFEILSSNASEFLCKFSASNANMAKSIYNKLISEIPNELKQIASFVGGFCEKPAGRGFAQNIEYLKTENRWQQYKMMSFPLANVESTAERQCELDGVRPGLLKPQSQKFLSTSVLIRQQNGRALKRKIYSEILKDNWNETLMEKEGYDFSKHLEELAINPKQGKLSGKIALIYLDGNRFGAIRDAFYQDEAALKKFQNHIQKYLREPALEAVLQRAAGEESFKTTRGKIAFEMLMWGGDEIEWVVPAWQALSVLNIFYGQSEKYRKIEHKNGSASGQAFNLTHSGGVVFCHHNLPILQVRKYTRQLCDLAKDQIREDISKLNAKHDCFAFLNMTTFDLLKGDVEKFLREYHKPASPQDFIVQAAELPAIHKNIFTLKQFVSRSKLFELGVNVKNQKFDQADALWQKILKLTPKQAIAIDNAKNALIGKAPDTSWQKWLSIADLIDYVGEVL